MSQSLKLFLAMRLWDLGEKVAKRLTVTEKDRAIERLHFAIKRLEQSRRESGEGK